MITMLVHHNDLIFPRSAFDGYRLKGRKQRVSVSVCSQRKAVWYMTTPPPSGWRWYGHWCITEGSPQPHRSRKGDISMRFHRFILLLMFVQGYKKKKKIYRLNMIIYPAPIVQCYLYRHPVTVCTVYTAFIPM